MNRRWSGSDRVVGAPRTVPAGEGEAEMVQQWPSVLPLNGCFTSVAWRTHSFWVVSTGCWEEIVGA